MLDMERSSREAKKLALRPLSAVGETEELISEYEAENKSTGETNKFDILCDGVTNGLAEAQASIQDLLQLKDSMLLHYMPPPLLFRLAVIVGKVYRAFSDLNTPVNELVRLTRIYSLPWDHNSIALRKLHEMYETKKQMLNIAIKRLTLVDKKTKLFEKDKRIQNWEKLYVKLSEAKSHGRRWKFNMETFRKKASLGYEELINWIKAESEGNIAEDIRKALAEKKAAEKDKRSEQLSARSSKSGVTEEDDERIEESVADIESDDESFLTKSSRIKSGKKIESAKPPAVTSEATTQTQPELEEKDTWTGEPDYKKYIIIRLFKPTDIVMNKMKCKITYGNTQFISRYLDPPKPEKKVKLVEENKPDLRKKGRLFGNKGKKDEKKDSETTTTTLEPISEKNKKEPEKPYEDFVFTIDDSYKRKEVLTTTVDNCVTFEIVQGDPEVLFAYVVVPIDDLQSLELPILYYKMPQSVTVIDHETNPNKDKDDAMSSNSLDAFDWLKFGEFTDESKETYQTMTQRQPLSFPMRKDKSIKAVNAESLGNLPIMVFWARKPIINRFDKNTGSQSIRDIVEELTGFDINKINRIQIEQLMYRSTRDSTCSPMTLPPPPRPPSTPIGIVKMSIEDMNNMEQKYTKDLQNVQDNYQLQIDQLKLTISELEDELGQLRSVHDLKTEGGIEQTPKSKRAIRFKNEEAKVLPPKSGTSAKRNKPQSSQPLRQIAAVYGKDLPEDFLERLKLFSEKSEAHHKEIAKKHFTEESSIREQQMSVQHRLDSNKYSNDAYEDFCLPAVFMPYKSNNSVFNPRAHQYFHPTGYNDLRLTQPPAVFQLPPLPSKSVSVVNLFELNNRYQAGEPDFYINQYISTKLNQDAKTDTMSMYSAQKPNSVTSRNNTNMQINVDSNESNDDYNSNNNNNILNPNDHVNINEDYENLTSNGSSEFKLQTTVTYNS